MNFFPEIWTCSWSGGYDTANNLLSEDSLVEAFGYSFNNIILTDINFDGIPDIDILSHPANRSRANEIHELWLAREDRTLHKYQNTPLSYCWADHKNMEIYNVYNGPNSPYFSRFRWVADSLIETETIHIDWNYYDEPNILKVIYSIREGNGMVVVSDKQYNAKDEIPIPDGYFNVTYIQW
jgi:hypothetical protein